MTNTNMLLSLSDAGMALTLAWKIACPLPSLSLLHHVHAANLYNHVIARFFHPYSILTCVITLAIIDHSAWTQ